MSRTAISELQALVQNLHDQRQAHLTAIADIDEAFGSLGIEPTKRRGRPRAAMKTAAKRTGKAKVAKKVGRPTKFKVTAAASVLEFVGKAGEKGVTGTRINKNWKAQGRSGSCYKTTGMLIQTKKLNRTTIEGRKRGSIYMVV